MPSKPQTASAVLQYKGPNATTAMVTATATATATLRSAAMYQLPLSVEQISIFEELMMRPSSGSWTEETPYSFLGNPFICCPAKGTNSGLTSYGISLCALCDSQPCALSPMWLLNKHITPADSVDSFTWATTVCSLVCCTQKRFQVLIG